ncbi:MAG: hypothetical protein JNM56_37785 [Planctomycetia bacterium]|nr:hypothetical protein [Planctomycetia bacterium]
MRTVHRWLLLALFGSLLVNGCARPKPRPVARPATSAAVVQKPPVAPEPEPNEEAMIQGNLAKLSKEDRDLASSQRFCAVEHESRLGSHGVPVKIMVKNQPVFLCCAPCEKAARKDEEKTLAAVAELKENTADALREEGIQANLAKLSKEDREAVGEQGFCPVERTHRLGEVGPPVKIKLKDQVVYLCCEDCRDDAEKNPDKTLAAKEEAEIKTAILKLPPDDRKAAEAQRWCALSPDARLGSMGMPGKTVIKGQPVFVCCDGCIKALLKEPEKTLATVEELKRKAAKIKPKD